jgi:hypothetical protein
MILDYSQEGLPIEYDESSAELIYKENRVPFSLIKSAVESGCNVFPLTEKLEYEVSGGFVTFGCLEITKEQFNKYYKQVWKLSKQSRMCKTVGN